MNDPNILHKTSLPTTGPDILDAPLDDVDAFVARVLAVPLSGVGVDLDAVLGPSLKVEADLRLAFASMHGIDERLEDPFIGIFDLFALPQEVRQVRRGRPPREMMQGGKTDDVHGIDALAAGYMFPLNYQRRRGTPSTVPTFDDFVSKWQIFTEGTLRFINWDNVIAAGGSVLACLLPQGQRQSARPNRTRKFFQRNYPYSDIDLFLWGLTEDEAKAKMVTIHEAIRKAIPPNVICIRKKNTVTIYSEFPYRTIQIVLRLYSSPAEVLTGFDVDCCCVGFDGTKALANPRAVMAFMRQCNTIDMSRRSPSYEFRLAKYAPRGFQVYHPSLDRDAIDQKIYAPRTSSFPNGLARLLVLERMQLMKASHPYRTLRNVVPKVVVTCRTSSETAMFKALDASDYDSAIAYIPYGPAWKATRIITLWKHMEKRLNVRVKHLQYDEYGQCLDKEERYIPHRHSFFVSRKMEGCFENFCRNCKLPVEGSKEAATFVYGPLQFIKNNPGRQGICGSFDPIDDDEWENEAYVAD